MRKTIHHIVVPTLTFHPNAPDRAVGDEERYAEVVFAENYGSSDPETAYVAEANRKAVEYVLSCLSPRTAEYVRLYYGLDGLAMTVSEIAKHCGVSRQRVFDAIRSAAHRITKQVSRKTLIELTGVQLRNYYLTGEL